MFISISRNLAGLVLLSAFGASAQDERVGEDADVELIVVTGSRVARTDLDGPAPVEVFSAEDLEIAGVNTLNDFFRYLPQNNNQFSEAAAMTRGFEGAGFIDLRGIGIDATLTLLNGRRIAPYAQGGGQTQPFVDVNAIPVAAIDRIEVLKDGASAIYGADAIAGVVNIILKDDYEGLQASIDLLGATEGDGEEVTADLLWGWRGERTGVMASLSWLDKSPIRSRDRAWTADVDFSDQGGFNFRSFNGTPTNYIDLTTGALIPDPECGADPAIAAVGDPGFGFGEACLFNYNYFANLTYERETIGATLAVDHTISPTLEARVEVLYNRNENRAVIAPSPVFGPFIAPDHPQNFLGVPLSFAARPIDVGNRIFDAASDTWRVLGELEGSAGAWDWTASVILSANDVDSTRRNAVIISAFQQALLGFGGPSGNQFYNPFGANPVNPRAVIDGFTTETRFGAKTTEDAIELEASRFFGELAGGEIGFVAGIQHRKQDIEEYADALELSGDIAGGGRTTLINADRDVTALYAEASLPLTADLEIQAAVRYDDYSDFGGATNPKLGFAWSPSESWILRGSYSESFRPPSFAELFNPRVEGVTFVADTPRCVVTGAPLDCQPRETTQFDSGNPELQPEEGQSRFLGVVFSPESLPLLRLQLDLWEFEHENRIVAVNPQIVLDNLGDTGIVRDPASPEDQALGIPGPIRFVERLTQNSDRLQTRGIDFTVQYGWDTNRIGRFNASLLHTWIDEYLIEAPGSGAPEPEDYAGRNFENPLPEHRSNINLVWQLGQHGASANIHYVDGYTEDFLGQEIDDHATLDLQYSFAFADGGSLVRIGCQNCTDEAPPVTFLPQGVGLYDYRGALVYARYQHEFR